MSFLVTQQSLVGQGLLILEDSRSHSRHSTLGRTYLDEWSARRRDRYPTTQNTHNRQTSMPSAGFEPIIPETERSQTYALERGATGIGLLLQPIGTNLSAENSASFFTLKGLTLNVTAADSLVSWYIFTDQHNITHQNSKPWRQTLRSNFISFPNKTPHSM